MVWSLGVLYSLEWYCMVMESLIWYFMVCMILFCFVLFSIVSANVFSCKIPNGLVSPYAAMHNFCACYLNVQFGVVVRAMAKL